MSIGSTRPDQEPTTVHCPIKGYERSVAKSSEPVSKYRERRLACYHSKTLFLCCIALNFISGLSILFVYDIQIFGYKPKENLTYEVAGWSPSTNRNTKLYVLPNNITIIHEPNNICSKTDSKNKLFLLIIVFSATDNFDRRINIRNTWGNYMKYQQLSKVFNIVRDRYKNYDFTYDLNQNLICKREEIFSISKLMPELVKALQSNIANEKTEQVPETTFQGDNMFKDFENKEFGEQTEGNYNNYDDESNIMKISPKGYEDNPDLDKVMSILKNDKYFPKIEEKLENLVDDNTEVDFKLAFILGLPVQRSGSTVQDKIEKEVVKYGDIIQELFLDTYNNLTLKAIMMLKWINNNCNDSVRYILKTDDDVYINVPNLMRNLRNRSREHDAKVNRIKGHDTKEYLLIGKILYAVRPNYGNVRAKTYNAPYMYNGRTYPPLVTGLGYVFTLPTASVLYKAALTTPYFHLEDIYITGICSVRASPPVPLQEDQTFDRAPFGHTDTCDVHAHVNAHGVTGALMATLARNLLDESLVDRCERIRLNKMRRDRLQHNRNHSINTHVAK